MGDCKDCKFWKRCVDDFKWEDTCGSCCQDDIYDKLQVHMINLELVTLEDFGCKYFNQR